MLAKQNRYRVIFAHLARLSRRGQTVLERTGLFGLRRFWQIGGAQSDIWRVLGDFR